MFIFKDTDNLFKVAQEKTHAIVVFKDTRTKEYRQSVEDIRELLFCDEENNDNNNNKQRNK